MIEFITFLISITGLLLLGTLFSTARMKSRKYHVKKHRSHTAGLVDLLNYAAVVDDGVIIGKNGSFMAAWLYQGEDIANTTDEAREVMAFRINQAMSSMGNGWMIHVDAIRRAAPGYSECSASYFPDLVSKAVDEERRQYFESIGALYEGYFVITLTWYPPVLAQKRFVELMFDDSGEKLNHKEKTHQLIETFKQACRNFESRMSAAIHLERLGSEILINENHKVTQDNFLRHIQYCVTGINHPVNLPKNPIYLDAFIGGQELIPGITPKIGRKFIQCVAIEGFPMESYPGILTLLTQLPVEYRWNSRFIFMDPHEAV
ncbi:TPA: conjugal transfer protein TrbE, partial [Legionella pneumophila]|nr:conjugal transfer protein TrbE [Legionella pneumophila]